MRIYRLKNLILNRDEYTQMHMYMSVKNAIIYTFYGQYHEYNIIQMLTSKAA